MTPIQADEIRLLAKSHPVPKQAKADAQVAKLQRMSKFYAERAPISKDGGAMFNSFVAALNHSAQVVRQYSRLTQCIADMAATGGPGDTSGPYDETIRKGA